MVDWRCPPWTSIIHIPDILFVHCDGRGGLAYDSQPTGGTAIPDALVPAHRLYLDATTS